MYINNFIVDECQNKYGNVNAWRYCTRVFDLLTIAAVAPNNIFNNCLHKINIFYDLYLSKNSCLSVMVTIQIIDEQILCVHGGLSPDIRTLDQVNAKVRSLILNYIDLNFTYIHIKFRSELSIETWKYPTVELFVISYVNFYMHNVLTRDVDLLIYNFAN